MKKILCYGDSNTWGFIPGSLDFTTGSMKRYPYNVRWTGRLQVLLGADYLIIEEGMCGRNTNIGNPPELGGEEGNGKLYLQSCLLSYSPLDWVVLMLGSNDFKASLNRSTENAASGLEELIQLIKTGRSELKILLISPPSLSTEYGIFSKIFKGADDKSRRFLALCAKLAKIYGRAYLDMAVHMTMSEIDGLHIDEANQLLFARLVAEKIIS